MVHPLFCENKGEMLWCKSGKCCYEKWVQRVPLVDIKKPPCYNYVYYRK